MFKNNNLGFFVKEKKNFFCVALISNKSLWIKKALLKTSAIHLIPTLLASTFQNLTALVNLYPFQKEELHSIKYSTTFYTSTGITLRNCFQVFFAKKINLHTNITS